MKQLTEGHLTVEELGDIYSLKSYQIQHVFNSLGITHSNLLGDTRIFDSNISSSTRQILIGMLMGDASMKTPRSYTVGHSIHQMDYLYHIAEKLHPFVASLGDKIHKKGKISFSFWTYSHELFVSYFDRFYSRGRKKKFFKPDTASDLGPEGLAYWFMDDGKFHEYGFYLCVGNISQEEGNVLVAMLKEKFGIESTFQNHDIQKGYHNIYIKAESRGKLLELIDPYIIPSMRYKCDGRPLNEVGFDVEKIADRHLKLCEAANRPIRYFGNPDVQAAINSKLTRKDPKSIYVERIKEDIVNSRQISKTFFRKSPSDEELKKLFERGMTDKFIGDTYGFGRNKIAGLRKSMGITRQRCRISVEKNRQLMNLFSVPGTTMESVMKEAHISYYFLKTWMEKNNILL